MTAHSRNTILIADDMASNRIFLRNILKNDYEVLEAANGEMAISQIERHHEKIAAVLLDLLMPGMDGIQTLCELRKMGCLDEFPVLVVTADMSVKNEARILELGATDMIHKPYDPVVIKRRVSNFVELFARRKKIENRADNLAKAINASSMGIISMLATVTEFRSLESGQHTLRIRSFTTILLKAIARLCPEYGLTQRDIELMANAAVLHDVGKVTVPDSVLNKPGKLTAEEFEIMKSHTTAGSEIVRKMKGMMEEQFVHYAYNICRYHHERWDGRGYPEGLKQDNIPLCAQVVSVCDVYDALTTPRVYKSAFPHEKAVEMILRGECGTFNPKILECFQQVLDQFRDCARKYADSAVPPKVEDIHMPEPISTASMLDMQTEQLATEKYHALFRLVNGVVLEVDMNTNTFELVYDRNRSFEVLHQKNKLYETMLELLNTAVHPEDKNIATKQLLSFQKDFFESGMRRQTRRYRIRNTPQGEYYWVESDFLRVYTGRPDDKKALCVWQRIRIPHDSEKNLLDQRDECIKQLKKLPWTILRCRQDRWMTIEDGMDSLAALLGYSVDELRELSHNRLMELVVAEDQERVYSFLCKARQQGSYAELEYRMRHKNGSTVWIADRNRVEMGRNGNEFVYRILLDNTRTRQELQETRIKLERQQLLLNNASEIFFEWDLTKEEIYITDNFQDTFGYYIKNGHFDWESAERPRMVHPDDLPLLRELMERINHGSSISEKEIRMMKADGGYLWCRVRLVTQQWENGKTVSILGAITNINADKLMMQHLKDQTQRDTLTGLTNRAAASTLIEQYLHQDDGRSRAAVLVVDIDNFKRVNDTYGHAAGDSVLVACGEALRNQFRSQDIVARLGGDEFLVFLRDISDQHAVEVCCQKLVERFARDVSSLVPDCEISCSVGVSVYPQDGRQFLQLQQNADKALLYAKEHGKNRCAIYSEIGEGQVVYRSTRTEIESNRQSDSFAQGLVAYTMHHLHQSGDPEKTIQKVLGMVGQDIHVSRVYIFENSRDNKYCSNTFEWCADGIPSVKEKQQQLSYETTMKDWATHFKDANIYYCRDTAQLPESIRALSQAYGEKSFLHCAIRDSGIIRGFVGFSDCRVNRLWTREQLSVLEAFAEMMSLFLLKKRAKDDKARWTENVRRLLNRSQELVYLINTDSYRLKFVNEKLKALLPEVELGQHCYESIMGRRSPCISCPVRKIQQGGAALAEIHSQTLGQSLSIQGTKLFWDGEDVTLLACTQRPEDEKEEERGS